MKVNETSFSDRVLNEIVKSYSYPPSINSPLKVHNIMYPRKTFFERKEPVNDIEPEQGLIFLTGTMQHNTLEDIISSLINGKSEQEIKFDDVIGHVDVLGDKVIEIKTTRAYKEQEIDDNSIYVAQIRYYAAMCGLNKGELIILYYNLNNGKHKKCMLKSYEIEFSEEEMNETRQEVSRRKKLILKALATGDFSELPKCPEWMCKNCTYSNKCSSE